MTVNDLAGEGQGTETASLQWHSDSTPKREVVLWDPRAVLGEGRGERRSVRGSEQSSKAGQELTWMNWDFLVVPISYTTLRSRWAPLPLHLLLSFLPPSPLTPHRVALLWGGQGIKPRYVDSAAHCGSWLGTRQISPPGRLGPRFCH